ncbi:MAG: HAD family hydrolase, partial [Pseudomonadota bacterium]
MSKPTIVFDLDGTLADTSADLIAAANVSLVRAGYSPQLDSIADAGTAFKGGRAMLRLAYSRLGVAETEVDFELHYQSLLVAYGNAIDNETRLYPGAIEAVREMRTSGWLTAICTNKPEGLAEELLRRLGVRDHF